MSLEMSIYGVSQRSNKFIPWEADSLFFNFLIF